MTRSTAGSTASSDPARPLVPPLSDADVPTPRPPAHSAGNRAARVPDLFPSHLVAAPPAPSAAKLPGPVPTPPSRPRPTIPPTLVVLAVAAAVLLGVFLYLVS